MALTAALPPFLAIATAAPTAAAFFTLLASWPAFGPATFTSSVPFSTAADPASRTSVNPVFNNFSVCEFMAHSRTVGRRLRPWNSNLAQIG
jgi:hypothetical protein